MAEWWQAVGVGTWLPCGCTCIEERGSSIFAIFLVMQNKLWFNGYLIIKLFLYYPCSEDF